MCSINICIEFRVEMIWFDHVLVICNYCVIFVQVMIRNFIIKELRSAWKPKMIRMKANVHGCPVI